MASIQQIAQLIGATIPTSHVSLARVSGIGDATPDCVVFATDVATYAAALNSCAGAILVSQSALQGNSPQPEHSSRLLVVPDARFAFALVARYLERERSPGE